MGRSQIPAKACSKWRGCAKLKDVSLELRAPVTCVLLSGEEQIDRVEDFLIHWFVCGGIECSHGSSLGFSSVSLGCGGVSGGNLCSFGRGCCCGGGISQLRVCCIRSYLCSFSGVLQIDILRVIGEGIVGSLQRVGGVLGGGLRT